MVIELFEPKHKCSNRVWATGNAVHPSIVERQCTVKKVLYVISLTTRVRLCN